MGYSQAALTDARSHAVVSSALAAGGFDTAWIGLHDPDGLGTLEWVDGVPIEYEQWAPGQPAIDTGDCGAVRLPGTGLWSTNDCTDSFAYVCGVTP
ncbi:MAG: C-type lectin domain-containing protein [Proteobacteria bacterium]|nr:C-type lectin domain-containing protein [Pseudomonadota bacterium]